MWSALIQTCTFSLVTQNVLNLIRYALEYLIFWVEKPIRFYPLRVKPTLLSLVSPLSGGFEEHINGIRKVKSGYKICSRDERDFGTFVLCIQKWSRWGKCGKHICLSFFSFSFPQLSSIICWNPHFICTFYFFYWTLALLYVHYLDSSFEIMFQLQQHDAKSPVLRILILVVLNVDLNGWPFRNYKLTFVRCKICFKFLWEKCVLIA